MSRKGDWIQTASGRKYYPGDPLACDVVIDDIAHALSHICRYAGHCKEFYSVAEHSYHVSFLVPREHALLGLLHDATEAYLVDLPRPVKRLPQIRDGYADLEHYNWNAIASKFGLPRMHEWPKTVKHADTAILLAERAVLMQPIEAHDWLGEDFDGTAPEVAIECWSPKVARHNFLTRFYQLFLNR